MLLRIPTLQKVLTTVQTTDRRDQVSSPQVDDLGFFYVNVCMGIKLSSQDPSFVQPWHLSFESL